MYETINASGLDSFYSIREKFTFASPKPVLSSTQYLYLDDEEYCSSLDIIKGEKENVITFSVRDMHCAACIWLLEKIPQVVDGINDVKSSLQRKEVRVTYERDKIKLSEVAKSFERYGYRPEVIENSEENRLLRTNNSNLNKQIARLAVAAFSAMNCMMLSSSIYEGWWSGIENEYLLYFNIMSMIVSAPAVFYSAAPFYKRAYSGIKTGQFHLDLPLSLGILLGYFLSTYCIMIQKGEVYYDSLTMLILLITVARVVQDIGLEKFNNKLRVDKNIFAKEANIIVNINGVEEVKSVYAKKVKVDDQLKIQEGDYVPVDGEIVSGNGFIDTSILTGEAVPQSVKEGYTVLAGSLLTSGSIIVKANKNQENSEIFILFSSLKERIENSSEISKKIDERSRYFIAYVFILAASSFFYFLITKDIHRALEVVLSVVVVSCPCALSLAAPLAFASCFHKAEKNNTYFSSSRSVELLGDAKSYFFDKTGTITEGKIEVNQSIWINPIINKDEILSKIISSEMGVFHPVATGLIKWATEQIDKNYKSEFILTERSIIDGEGIFSSFSDGKKYRIGKKIEQLPETNFRNKITESQITVSENDNILLIIGLSDEVRAGFSNLIKWLFRRNKEIFILSGDRQEVVKYTADQVGVSLENTYFELKPKDKLELVSKLGESPKVMVGDGINDTLAMSTADVSISIAGGLRLLQKEGTIAITNFRPEILISAIKGAKSTSKAIRISLLFSLIYNMLGTVVAALGYLNPLLAAILMPFSSAVVILVSSMVPNFSVHLDKKKSLKI